MKENAQPEEPKEPNINNGIYEIATANDLVWFCQNASKIESSTVVLTADIDMASYTYNAPFYATSLTNLSHTTSTIYQPGFKGIFDGQGHTISNLTEKVISNHYSTGLVGNNSGTIKNIILDNYSYNNNGDFDGRFGAICGVNFGTIENCAVINSSVKSHERIVGIIAAGNYGGTIKNCYAKECETEADSRIGHLVGDACNDNFTLKGKIINCYADNILEGNTYYSQKGESCTGIANLAETDFTSGKVTYLLNSDQSRIVWYQNLSEKGDKHPVLYNSHGTVYYGYNKCFESPTYSNSTLTDKPQNHNFNAAGVCINCGKSKEENVKHIIFVDANVKTICVKNWDTNNDGELSYEEAAAVTDMGRVFKGQKDIQTFDELQYFTGVKTLFYCEFEGCSNLKSVIIPNSVEKIEEGAFTDAQFTSINIPASVTSIHDNAFNSSNIESITVDPENKVFDSRNNCNAIMDTEHNYLILGCKNTVIPNGTTKIANKAFHNCLNLKTIEIPNTVKSIGYYAFNSCI